MAANFQMIVGLLLFAFVLSMVEFSTCHVLKSSVTCLDCDGHSNLSGIKVLVKCNQVRKLAVTTTQENGAFETELPSDTPTSSPSLLENCQAKILGAQKQLYISRKNILSTVVEGQETDSYTLAQPLSFYTSCPLSVNQDGKCGGSSVGPVGGIGESKTIDLPLPREWGLAPSSYYVPFFPIIGIP